jgi:integrase
MELVQPIRDKKQIELMKKVLKAQNVRDYALFVLGINSGLRISDILKLNIKDVVDENGNIKDYVAIREQKSGRTIKTPDGKEKRKEGKLKQFPISDTVKKALREYLKTRGEYKPDDPLFISRKKSGNGQRRLQRAQAYRIINNAAKQIGLATDTYRIGTHTLRKTFGYHAYKAGYDLEMIQDLLNHSSPAITLRYIGITQEEKDQVYLNLNL